MLISNSPSASPTPPTRSPRPDFARHDLAVERKPDRTPVTDADIAVEDAVRAMLAAERPHDVVMGEERGGTPRRRRAWVLDPIDGTKNFLRGVPSGRR